jgi:hypothetical protein
MIPANNGAPLASAIPKQSGSATRNTTKPDWKSDFKFSFKFFISMYK